MIMTHEILVGWKEGLITGLWQLSTEFNVVVCATSQYAVCSINLVSIGLKNDCIIIRKILSI